jgi:phospholipid/cholesterol/gamma-HCH transport system ATP-binding protein
VIEARAIRKAFNGQAVLTDVNCRIARGLTTVILGSSGAGKSVFAKLLVGLLRPDSGRILFDGAEVTTLSEHDLYRIRRKVGMCFQDGALFNSMSVGENVAFPLRRHTRLPEREIRRVVADKLEVVGLPGVAARMPADLSGGMRKRVGIARAIALDPELVIFDEPTTGLDPIMADAIDQLILGMRGRERTFLVISHDLPSTWVIADRVGMIHAGRMLALAEKPEFFASPDPVVRQFLARLDAGAGQRPERSPPVR